MQTWMSARALSKMTVDPTPCVPILKDPTCVAVMKVTPETERRVQVLHRVMCVLLLCFSAPSPALNIYQYDACVCSLFIDINECRKPEENECHANALCNNTEGSYVCRCFNGYRGDGKNCTGKTYFIGWLLKRESRVEEI